MENSNEHIKINDIYRWNRNFMLQVIYFNILNIYYRLT